jgi:hypothetical protein
MVEKQFRVLYREFLFRLIDRELLAGGAQGDANRLLGRLAAILIWLSIPFAAMALGASNARVPRQEMLAGAWGPEHSVIATTMLVVALFGVLSWDTVLPDRRDVLVLGPLPVRARTIFAAKAASLAAALGITVSVFNGLPGLAMPFALTPPGANLMELALSIGLYRSFLAYWLTMFAAGAFVLLSMLSVQALAAQLPRAMFLRVTPLLQIATFCLCIGVYFLQPALASPHALTAPGHERTLAWLPTYWFLGLFQQLNGSTEGPAQTMLSTLAARAWSGLAIAGAGGCGAFLLCYYRTLRKIVEQPDIAPGSRRSLWLPRFGGPVTTAIVQFAIRTLLRSRQHRVILAFWSGMGFAILILYLKTPFAEKIAAAAGADLWRQASVPVIASSFVMLCFWTLGIRIAITVPVELNANWTFRIAPLPCVSVMVNALRAALYTMAVAPLWVSLAMLLLWIWPLRMAAGHLVVFGLVASVAVELCLYGFQKVPFTCSYLPGKSHLHITVCLCLMLGMNLLYVASEWERRALRDAKMFAAIVLVLAPAAVIAWRRTQHSAGAALGLIFEDEQPSELTSLGLFRDGFLPAQPGDSGSSARSAIADSR